METKEVLELKDITLIEINRIMTEISECREDERCGQNRILQVVSLVGTALAALFAFASIADFSKGRQNMLAILSIISDLIFVAGFTYISLIGFENVIRYHYIVDLESALKELYKKVGVHMDGFHNWMEILTPVTTRNIKHIKQGYAFINYIIFNLSMLSAMGFGVFITYCLYKMSKDIQSVEIGFWFLITVGIIMFVIFIVGSSISKSIYNYCKRIAGKKDGYEGNKSEKN